jgi:hypothetical protein
MRYVLIKNKILKTEISSLKPGSCQMPLYHNPSQLVEPDNCSVLTSTGNSQVAHISVRSTVTYQVVLLRSKLEFDLLEANMDLQEMLGNRKLYHRSAMSKVPDVEGSLDK